MFIQSRTTIVLTAATIMIGGIAPTLNANDVRVEVSGTSIAIYGDDYPNQVDITIDRGPATAYTFTISTSGGTIINGWKTTFAQTFPAGIDQLEIQMAGGDDFVTVSEVASEGDVFIDLGPGNDTLQSQTTKGIVRGNLDILGGPGADAITMGAIPYGLIVGSEFMIDGQAGRLEANVSGVSAGKLKVIGDDAADTLILSDLGFIDDISIETKGGDDTVMIDQYMGEWTVTVDTFTVKTDSGADTVQLTNIRALGDLSVFTGPEDDSITFDFVVGNIVAVSTGDGADTFRGRVWAQNDAIFEGGNGYDTFIDQGINAGSKREVKEFEATP